jgi:hypothetical protein
MRRPMLSDSVASSCSRWAFTLSSSSPSVLALDRDGMRAAPRSGRLVDNEPAALGVTLRVTDSSGIVGTEGTDGYPLYHD